MNEPRIVCAAIKYYLVFNDCEESVIVCSPRHWDSITHQTFNNFDDYVTENVDHVIQGFVDQFGTFYTREEAWIIAEKNNQIIRRVGGDGVKLYSENLY